jgi:hypothetical protein
MSLDAMGSVGWATGVCPAVRRLLTAVHDGCRTFPVALRAEAGLGNRAPAGRLTGAGYRRMIDARRCGPQGPTAGSGSPSRDRAAARAGDATLTSILDVGGRPGWNAANACPTRWDRRTGEDPAGPERSASARAGGVSAVASKRPSAPCTAAERSCTRFFMRRVFPWRGFRALGGAGCLPTSGFAW